MKKRAILGILAALAALGAVLAMSGVVYASFAIPDPAPVLLPGQANAQAEVTVPGGPVIITDTEGGSFAGATVYMGAGSSGDASATSNARNDRGSSADATANSSIDDGSYGMANSTANAVATGYGSDAVAAAVSYIGTLSDPVTNSVASATAANGGSAVADATAGVGDGATGNNTAYAYANSTGGNAISITDIETGAGAATPAAGFYNDIYFSGDSFAWSWLFVPGPSNIVGFTYTNAGSTDAFADVVVSGSYYQVIASGVIPPP